MQKQIVSKKMTTTFKGTTRQLKEQLENNIELEDAK
jgi:hypothetical protein